MSTASHPFPGKMQIWPLYNGWRQYLLPSQTSFQAKQSQFSHPLPLYHKPPSKHFHVLPLNSLQFVSVSFSTGEPEIRYSIPGVSHQCQNSPWSSFSMKAVGVPAVQTAHHLTALFPVPVDSSSPNSDTDFLQFLCRLPSLPHSFYISVPFIARATSSHSFLGSLALLICYFFPFLVFSPSLLI